MQETKEIEKNRAYQPSRQSTSIIDDYMRINMLRFVRNRNTEDPAEQIELETFPLDDIEDKKWFADACYDKLLGENLFEKATIDEFIELTIGSAYTSSVVTAIRSVSKDITNIKMVKERQKIPEEKEKKELECGRVALVLLANMSPVLARLTTQSIIKGQRSIELGDGLWDGIAYALSDKRACHFFTVHSEFMPFWIKTRLKNAKLHFLAKDRKHRSKILAFINRHADIKSALEDILCKMIISAKNDEQAIVKPNANQLSMFERYVWRNIKWKSAQLAVAKPSEQLLPTSPEGEIYAVAGLRRGAHVGMRYDDNAEEVEQSALCQRLLGETTPIIFPVVNIVACIAKWWRKMVIDNQKKEEKKRFSEYVQNNYLLYADLFEMYAGLMKKNISHILQMCFYERVGHDIVFKDPHKKHSKIMFKADDNREARFITPCLLDLVSNEEIIATGKLFCDIRRDVLTYAAGFRYSSEYQTPAEWVVKRYRFDKCKMSFDLAKAIIIGGENALRMLRAAVATSLEEHCKLRGKIVGRHQSPKDMMKHRVVSALPEILRFVSANRDVYDFEVCRAFFSLVGIAPGLANPVGKDIVFSLTDKPHERAKKVIELKKERARGIIRENGIRWRSIKECSDDFNNKPIYRPLLHGMGSSIGSVIGQNLTNTEIYYLIIAGETPPQLRESLEDCGRYKDHRTGKYRKAYELSKNGMWVKYRKPIRSRQATRHVKLT